MISPVTFAMIKPKTVSREHAFDVIKLITEAGFRIERIALKGKCPTTMEVLYHSHKGRPYYEDLVSAMADGSVVPMVLSAKGEDIDVVARFRDLIGSTKSAEARPGTIRHAFGGHRWNPNAPLNDNAIHASDSLEAVAYEAKLFFPDFNISDYAN